VTAVLSSGAIVLVLGFVALLGWLLDLPLLRGFGADTVPMAPSTALLFIAYGVVLGLRARQEMGRRAALASGVIGGVAAVAAVVLLVLSSLGIRTPVEHLGMAITGDVRGTPVGHMSPVTAACFLLASLPSLMSLSISTVRSVRKLVAFGSAGLLFGTSFVFLLAYLYGSPLLYGGGFIPPAANTTLAFAALGFGLLVTTGRRGGTPEELHQRTRASGWFLLVFILLAAGMVAAGHFYFQDHERHYRAEVQRQLSAIADLKVSELTHWRRERIGDGTVFLGNANFSELVQRCIETPQDQQPRARVGIWLHQVREAYQYDRLFLLDAGGVELASVPVTSEPVAPHLKSAVSESLRTRRVSFLDFHRDGPGSPIHLSVLVPIYAKQDNDRPLGVLVLQIDPAVQLYPILQRWPTSSRTAETLIVRRDGDDVLFLNELRFRKNAALSLREPLSNERLPAVKAVLGHEGSVEGVDYRGVDVIAEVRSVPNSPWFLVARMDAAEVYAPLTERVWLMVLLVVALLFGSGAALGLAWRLQSTRFYREKYEAAAALRASEVRYRELVENIEDIVFSMDGEGRVLYVSPAVQRIYGYTPDELVGRHFRDFVQQDDLPGFTASFQRTLQGSVEPYEFRGLDNQGRVHHLRSTSRLRLENGVPVGMNGVVIDISKLHHALDAQRLSAERWQATFDAISDVVCVVSNDHQFIEINQTGCKSLGLTRDQIVGRKCYELVHCTSSPIAACPCRMAAQAGAPASARHEENGRSYELLAWPIATADGQPNGFVHIVKDVTSEVEANKEKVKLEEQLKLVQRLEAVGRLAGGVAHDFNNLLSVIISYAGFAVDALRESDPVHADIVEIQKAGQRAAALTRQLLAFSRKQILEPEVLSINKVVTGIESMLRRLLGEDIDIEVHRADELGSVLADPGQIEQVIMNLAVNARDAMPQGGKLTIETINAELDEDYAEQHVAVKPGRFVMLSVTDTGSGMDAETRAHIFEPFFTTKEKGKGTGLGLSTVYGIVKQSGGNIWVYSEPGRGTTFKVYLPRVDAPAADIKRRPVSVMATGSETVLLVEDEEAVRRLADRILRSAGYKVLTAAGGSEALLLCEKHDGVIDLLLTDVVMPHMSGRELAERLAKTSPKLKVLYMSGYTDNAIVHHGVLDPGTRFIGKPFAAAELTRKVREVLDEGKVVNG
jgi:PAS domain S-box-containing protein